MPTRDVILLIEDSNDDALLIQRSFERATVENRIFRVRSGDAALGYLTGIAPYDDRAKYPVPVFILLDINMPPGMNGLEVLRWLRAQSGLRRIPVVVLTSDNRERTVNSAYDAGA